MPHIYVLHSYDEDGERFAFVESSEAFSDEEFQSWLKAWSQALYELEEKWRPTWTAIGRKIAEKKDLFINEEKARLQALSDEEFFLEIPQNWAAKNYFFSLEQKQDERQRLLYSILNKKWSDKFGSSLVDLVKNLGIDDTEERGLRSQLDKMRLSFGPLKVVTPKLITSDWMPWSAQTPERDFESVL